MPESLYKLLEPYVIIPEKNFISEEKKQNTSINSYTIVNINTEDKLLLEKLPGIGKVLAERIVKYQQLLGGYCKKEQLLEVYGIDSVLYKQVEPFISVDGYVIKKKNINTNTFKELISHPYLDYKMIKALVNYRNRNGKFQSTADIRKINCTFDSVYNKIIPYLEI